MFFQIESDLRNRSPIQRHETAKTIPHRWLPSLHPQTVTRCSSGGSFHPTAMPGGQPYTAQVIRSVPPPACSTSQESMGLVQWLLVSLRFLP